MPNVEAGKPKRKSMFLSPTALEHLTVTSARRRTEREAVEEALELLAARDAQRDALQAFVDWANQEWGPPTEAEHVQAEVIWSSRDL